MTTKTATALLLPALTFFAGCNWLEFPAYVLFGQPGTKVPAQYTGLESATTAVVVVTDPATDFDFPYARLNLALISAHQVSQKLKNTTFVDQETIDTFQNEDLDWYHLSMQQLGRKFNADRILYLDVMRFSMVEDNSIGLVRGRIIADASPDDIRTNTDERVRHFVTGSGRADA